MGMRNTLDRKKVNATPPIDKALGTAYDVVASVAEKLPIITYLEQNVDTFVTDIHSALDTSVAAAQAADDRAAAALASQNAAKLSEDASHASELASAQSESNAAASESASLAHREAAADSQAAALASQNAAHDSEVAAADSQAAALVSQNAAHDSEVAAALSETNAGHSETAAAQSAGDAATARAASEAARDAAAQSESSASASAAAASDSQAASALSEQHAGTSETNAHLSELASAQSAQSASDSLAQVTTLKGTTVTKAAEAAASAQSASDSAAAALASKTAAKTSEDNSKLSENNSKTSETNAGTARQAAQDAQAAAVASAAAALLSEQHAATSETNAGTSAAQASASATSAAQSAAALNSELQLTVTGGTTVLTTAQMNNSILKITGALVSNAVIELAASPKTFAVQNLTTGSFTLTVKATGKTPSVQVVQGKSATMFTDTSGCFAISAAPGVSWGNQFPYSADQVLDISHLGAQVTQSAPSTTTFPKASTFPPGSGFGFRNSYTGSGVKLALQGGDTASDLSFPYTTQPNDSMFWYSDGVSQWILGWFSNRPGTYYIPQTPLLLTLAYGATSVAPPGGYTPGFVGTYLNGARLVNGVDIDATDGVNINFLTFVGDGVSQIEITRQTPVPVADVVQRSNPVLGNPLTFADGTQQGSAAIGKNRIINGCFRIAQRPTINLAGTAGTYVEGFGGPDRWVAGNSAGGTLTQDWQAFLFNGRNYPGVRHLVTAVPTNLTGGNYWSGHLQRLEAVNVFDLHDGPIAISFPFVSTVSGTFSVAIRVPQGTAYSYVTTFTAVANTPKLVTISVPQMPSAASIDRTTSVGMMLHIGALNTGTFQCSTANLNSWQTGTFISAQGATNWASSTGNSIMSSEVQLEAGATATPFERRQYGLELALCQRYYEAGVEPFKFISNLSGVASAYDTVPFVVSKRVAPTMTLTGWKYYSGGSDTVFTPSNVSAGANSFTFQGLGLTNWCGWDGLGTWTASAEL
jgi:hypothetical protein